MHQVWTPLWNSIVDSSLWDEDDAVCKVFITLLALKDEDHVVRCNAYQIAKKCGRKSEDEVLECLKILASPDKKRKEKQEFDGRRIEKVEEGWLVLNGQKYQDLMQTVVRRRKQAQWQREQRMIERAVREGKALNPSELTPGLKNRYERAREKWRKLVQKKVDLDGEICGRQEGVDQALRGNGTPDLQA